MASGRVARASRSDCAVLSRREVRATRPGAGRAEVPYRCARLAVAKNCGAFRAFAAPDEFVKSLQRNGFVGVAAVPLTFGIVFLYTGRRG